MQDVMTHVFTSSTVTRQGFAIIGTPPLADYQRKQRATINQGVASGQNMLNRLDEVNYYTNGSGIA